MPWVHILGLNERLMGIIYGGTGGMFNRNDGKLVFLIFFILL
jgi:hypothetical protein